MTDISKLTKVELIEKLKELETEYEELEQRYNDLDDCYAELENQRVEEEKEENEELSDLDKFLKEMRFSENIQREIFSSVVNCIANSGTRFVQLDIEIEASRIEYEKKATDEIYYIIEKYANELWQGECLK